MRTLGTLGGLGLAAWWLTRTTPADAATSAPATPHTPNGRRLTHSTVDAHGLVIETPAALLAQARTVDPAITLDELTAARLASSEFGRGTTAELAAIVDAELERATRRRKSLTDHMTPAGRYAKQGYVGGAPRALASTRLDPYARHLAAARAVLGGALRGIALGAEQFFDPRAQLSAWRRDSRTHCPPHVVLERWAYALPWADRRTCSLDRRKARPALEWVGHIAGIDATRLLLMRPATAEHTARYQAARALIAQLEPIA